MIEIFFKLIALLLFFGIIFSILPKYCYTQIKKLLTFNHYETEAFKKRFLEIIKTYLILGLTLGFVFIILFSLNGALNIKDITQPENFEENTLISLAFSFIISYLLIFILRISTLLNKSNVLCWFLPKEQKIKIKRRSLKYNYKILKSEIISFLFSIFLIALLSLLIFISYKILFDSASIIFISFNITYLNFGYFFLSLLGFIIILFGLAALGEAILQYVGVRPGCREETN